MKERLFTRNFTFLVLGQICSLLGNYTLKFAMSMYVLEQTGSASIFAGLLAMAMVPTILLSPFGGILADRANRKHIMVSLDAVSGISVLTASLIFPLGNDMAVIGTLLVVLSILGAFESPTVQACIPQMLSGDNILKGNAVVSQIQAIAALVTPFLGSIVYTAFGIRPVLYGTVVCFFLTAFLECFIHLEYERPENKMGVKAVIKEDFAVSMRFLCKEEPNVLKLLLLAALVSMFAVGIVAVGFPYMVRTTLGLSAEHYGAAESAMGAAAILGSITIGLLAKRIQLRYLYIFMAALGICLLPAGIGFCLPLNPFRTYLVLLAMFCCCQFSCSIFSVYAISAIQERTPGHLTGKVMSCIFTISMCAQPVGQLLYGMLFDKFSNHVSILLIASGILICLIGITTVPFFGKMDNRVEMRSTESLTLNQDEDII